MSKIVAIDSQIFVWGIKQQSTTGQEAMIDKAKHLFSVMSKHNYKLVIPSPIIGETLCPVPPLEHAGVIALISKTMQVAPYDIPAASKFAEMMAAFKGNEELKEYRRNGRVPRELIKMDYVIAGIALARGCECIISHDVDMVKFASPFIPVLDIDTFIGKVDPQVPIEFPPAGA